MTLKKLRHTVRHAPFRPQFGSSFDPVVWSLMTGVVYA